MGELNIDPLKNGVDTTHYLPDLYDNFSLAILISSCALCGASINVLLTNRTRGFHNAAITETGISNHHKLIISIFRSHFERIPPKKS